VTPFKPAAGLVFAVLQFAVLQELQSQHVSFHNRYG